MEALFAELVSDGFARLFLYGWFLVSMPIWNGRFVMDWPTKGDSTVPRSSAPESRRR